MATKDITAMQYAAYKCCTVQNIRKHLRQTGLQKFPEVIDIKRYSRFYLFVVDESMEIPHQKRKIKWGNHKALLIINISLNCSDYQYIWLYYYALINFFLIKSVILL